MRKPTTDLARRSKRCSRCGFETRSSTDFRKVDELFAKHDCDAILKKSQKSKIKNQSVDFDSVEVEF